MRGQRVAWAARMPLLVTALLAGPALVAAQKAASSSWHRSALNRTSAVTKLGAPARGLVTGEHACDGWDEEWDRCPNLAPCGSCTPINCEFGEWAEWYGSGGCTGLRFHQRSIKTSNNECGKPCMGPKIESQVHVLDRCSVHETDCAFSEWSQWTECASRYDQSLRSRTVERPPSRTGEPCKGGLKETKACGTGHPPLDCVFASWREWTTCSATCGRGRHTRMRSIAQEAVHGGRTCEDTILETQTCKIEDCPVRDCQLSTWTSWSVCDEAHTQRYRNREVQQTPLNEGEACPENLVETEGCPEPVAIDCVLTEWTAWSHCDKTCEGGQIYRERQLQSPNSNGGKCGTYVLKETTMCNTGPCWTEAPDDCQLGTWEEWSSCSARCGKGSKTRSRKVLSLATSSGKGCEGALQEISSCLLSKCTVVDCAWSDWEEWSACSCSCGGGTKRRSRAVAASPLNGGALCSPKDKSEVAPCNTERCDKDCVDGRWSAWMEWSSCTATCSSGFKSRRRDIELQPNACGSPVSGLREEFVVCSELPPCVEDKDCELATWGEWSHCSCHCFGTRERNRYIRVFASGKGKPCIDSPLKVIEPCNPIVGEPVPSDCGEKPAVDCKLGEWEKWSVCTAPCGGGQMERKRSVVTPPSHGGKPCDGTLIITIPCNTQRCQPLDCQDCQWGSWSEWGDCSKCGGQRFRHRSIEKLPNHCGKPCEPKVAKEVSNCTSTCHKTAFCVWTEWSDSTSCNAGCGSATTMRNRAMTLKKEATNGFIFQGHDSSRCTGSQLNVSVCPFVKSCTPECIPRPCLFDSWGEWTTPTCTGLCERQRRVAQTNNECGEPCGGSLLETKTCPAECQAKKDCKVSEWSEWSQCAANAVSGQKYRSRKIKDMPENGGLSCKGILEETAGCNTVLPEPCKFAHWGAWSACSKSCGDGWHMRIRRIQAPASGGGEQCSGNLKELGRCTGAGSGCFNKTKVDCQFSGWAEWSGCGSDGQRYRDRKLLVLAEHGGKACNGTLHQTETCHEEAIDCIMSGWTFWDDCDKTCGGGQMHRHRQVDTFPAHGGKTCSQELIQTKGCNTESCDKTDCQVSRWSEWSECSTTCGVGLQTRDRRIVSLRSPGGAGCDFALGETRDCPENPSCGEIDCAWDEWSEWSGCTCTCGGGQHTRSRRIKKQPSPGGRACDAKDKEQIQPCNTQKCGPEHCVDGEFGDWQEWGSCTVSCGGGVTWRHRKITKMANACGREPEGKNREVKFCNVDVQCEEAVDCVLSRWGEWTECSASCNGVRKRSRHVATYGRGSGKWCTGALKETWPCNPGPDEKAPEECAAGEPIDCLLSEWASWSTCTATCGGGQHTRIREIAQPASNGGMPCEGSLSEVKECARNECHGPAPVDCAYGDWQDWGACSKCSGEMVRYRNIKTYSEHGGKKCEYLDTEEAAKCPRSCHEKLYCTWNDWGSWGKCTATCGEGGKRHRKRYLELSHDSKAAPPPPVEDLIDRYEALSDRTRDLEAHHMQELIVAFGAGCLSLVAGFAVVRSLSMARNRIQGPAAAAEGVNESRTLGLPQRPTRGGPMRIPQSLAAPLYHQLNELNETELPLIEPERAAAFNIE
mmetsp:Transcript_26237/g.55659  ORF Transcript_26237/g.55659 Transcript_26237/m.55659 type:complete len:1597 (+) Transcript_26237:60-4850(+)